MKKLLIGLVAIALVLPFALAKAESSLEDQVLGIIKKNPKVIKDALEEYEKVEEARKQEEEFKQILQDKVTVEIGKSPIHGKKNAKYTIIAFSDFQCPFCKRGDDTIKALEQKYGDDIAYVFKHFPLGFHPKAKPASQALWAAGEQGKFYEYHDKLWENQSNLGDELYVQIATDLGLDIAKFNADRVSEASEAQIKADMEAGQAVGIRGTPGFILNGVKIYGAYPVDHFEKVMQFLDKE